VNEPDFLTIDEVLRIHARSLIEHGGSEGVRELGLVDSALASAKNIFYHGRGDLFDVAAGYAFIWLNRRRSLTETSAQRSLPRWFFWHEMAPMLSLRLGNCTPR
jgi:hypothetical protein